MTSESFHIELEVRDYECDIEGIVNNAVYMNYLEHARHHFIRARDYNFADLTRKGIHLVVIRIEADYLYPLRTGDRFRVSAAIERISKLRFGFAQQIHRQSDDKPIMNAMVIATSLNAQGQPKYFEELEKLFA